MEIVGNFDMVVSLVPAPFHLGIAKKVNMVTVSYQTPEMKALSDEAKHTCICIMNEIGLDPGIDHLAAMEIIDKAHEKGDEIESFVSWCGGIPAPDDNDNPLGYKFSWEPSGAIMVLLHKFVMKKSNGDRYFISFVLKKIAIQMVTTPWQKQSVIPLLWRHN